MSLRYAKQIEFHRALFGGEVSPGHGVRVNVPGPADVRVVSQGSVTERIRMGVAMLEWERHCADAIGDDRVPMAHVWTGTDVFAAAFGSPVHRPADNMPFAMPAVFTAEEADALTPPTLDADSLRTVFALADGLRAACGDDTPLRIFDIQSPFDIAALIWRKEAFFVALADTPDAVHRLLRKVTDTVALGVGAFRDRYPNACLVHYPELWMPAEWGICLSEDDVGSISARYFTEFCLPYLQALGHQFGGVSLHCCARSGHQWQGFRQLPGVRYLNLFSPPVNLEQEIATFSGFAVLTPGPHARQSGTFNGHESYLEMVEDCLRLARPDTRFFFVTEAPTIDEAARLVREIKMLCGRKD